MKKFLLLASAALVAASASAQLPAATEMIAGEDITPKGYDFNNCTEFIGFTNGPANQDWNMPNHWFVDNVINGDMTFGDGMIVTGGGEPFRGNEDNWKALNAASKIVDFGGTLGKCLVINAGTAFADEFKKLTNKDLEIGTAPAAYLTSYWHLDPDKTLAHANNKSNMRVRIELNYFSPAPNASDSAIQPFMNDDENNVRPQGSGDNNAADRPILTNEFCYRWGDMEPEADYDPEVYTDENEQPVWNPYRFMVYEWDFDAAAMGDSEVWNYTPRIKMEMPKALTCGGALIIRSIKFVVPTEQDRELIVMKRSRTWNTYTIGDNVGVENIVADENAPVEYFNLQGVRVANPENGIFIRRQGAKATKVVM